MHDFPTCLCSGATDTCQSATTECNLSLQFRGHRFSPIPLISRFAETSAISPHCFQGVTAAEIKDLLDHLALRERTLVLLAVSTGLRQSELFALK
jgi:integrase